MGMERKSSFPFPFPFPCTKHGLNAQEHFIRLIIIFGFYEVITRAWGFFAFSKITAGPPSSVHI